MPAEHPNAPANCGLDDAALADLRWATQLTNMALIETLVPSKKYNWQAFGASDGVNPGVSKANCLTYMRTMCAPAMQGAPLMTAMDNAPDNANQTIAAFLITRPPYAYIGWGWESDDRNWNDLFWLQAGEPTGLCVESPAGVFSRPSWPSMP